MFVRFVRHWRLQWVRFCWQVDRLESVLLLPHARIMIHQPSGGAQGQSRDIEITAREIVKIRQELYEILAKHSGKII